MAGFRERFFLLKKRKKNGRKNIALIVQCMTCICSFFNNNKKKCTWHIESMNFHKSSPKTNNPSFPVKFKSLLKRSTVLKLPEISLHTNQIDWNQTQISKTHTFLTTYCIYQLKADGNI